MNVLEQLLAQLRALGASSDKVAATLDSLGIKGYNTRGECPIAEFLNRIAPRDAGWAVAGGQAYVPFGYESIVLPRFVQVFVERFDKGRYPSLDARNHPEQGA